jgi:hypothetical protein
LKGTHQPLIRMGGVNVLGGKTITVKQASSNPGRQDAQTFIVAPRLSEACTIS